MKRTWMRWALGACLGSLTAVILFSAFSITNIQRKGAAEARRISQFSRLLEDLAYDPASGEIRLNRGALADYTNKYGKTAADRLVWIDSGDLTRFFQKHGKAAAGSLMWLNPDAFSGHPHVVLIEQPDESHDDECRALFADNHGEILSPVTAAQIIKEAGAKAKRLSALPPAQSR